MQHAPRMTSRDWALLVVLSVLWGGSFFFVGVAVREWPPLPIVLLRVAIAAAALWSLVAVLRLPVRRDSAALGTILGMGVMNNAIPFVLIVWAQGSLPSGVASILNATTPLWGVVVAHLAGAERATPRRLAGPLLGFAGVAAMVGADPTEGLSGHALATAAMLLATATYALAGLFGRRVRSLDIPPLVAAAGQTAASTLLLLPPVLMLSPPWTLPAPSPAMAAALAGLGLLSTALAYLLYFRLLASAGPVNLMLVALLVPVSAILLGALLLGEALAPRHALGMAGVAAGLALIDGRLVTRLRRRGVAA